MGSLNAGRDLALAHLGEKGVGAQLSWAKLHFRKFGPNRSVAVTSFRFTLTPAALACWAKTSDTCTVPSDGGRRQLHRQPALAGLLEKRLRLVDILFRWAML